jgi:hypothetical protein
MIRSALEWIGGFAVVFVLYFLYREFTDPLFTSEYMKGFFAAIVLIGLISFMKELRK